MYVYLTFPYQISENIEGNVGKLHVVADLEESKAQIIIIIKVNWNILFQLKLLMKTHSRFSLQSKVILFQNHI